MGMSSNVSSDDEEPEEEPDILVKRGNLFKWTNYLSGWQCRYVVVERGTLSYYRNELDMEFGCRGVIHLGMLFIRPHHSICPEPLGPSGATLFARTEGLFEVKVVKKAVQLKLKLLNMTLIHHDSIYFYLMERRGISGDFFYDSLAYESEAIMNRWPCR